MSDDNKSNSSALDRVPAEDRAAFAEHKSEEVDGLLAQLWEKQERLDACMQRLSAQYATEFADIFFITSSVPAAQQPLEGGGGGGGGEGTLTLAPPPTFALNPAATRKNTFHKMLLRDVHCTTALEPVLTKLEEGDPKNREFFALSGWADIERLAPSTSPTGLWRKVCSRSELRPSLIVAAFKGFAGHYDTLLSEAQAAAAKLGKCQEKQADVEKLLKVANAWLHRLAALGSSFGPAPGAWTWKDCAAGSSHPCK